MTTSGRSRWQSIFALALVAVACSAVSPALAQSYRTLKPQIELAQAKVASGRVATILRDANNPGDAEKKVLDDLFMKYLFPSMTAYDPPEVLGQLANSREQLFTRYINTTKSQGARDYLNSKTLLAMSSIAKGPFHPAVRYNAALIVGQLDQAPGTPLPAANEVLISLLENDAFPGGGTKEKPIQVPAPTALKVAAIIGLQRRIAGLEPAMAERVAKASTAIALRKETPDDASPEVYGWVRKNAAKLLTAQVASGMTPEVQQTMVTLISDKTIDLDDRCSIAQLLKPDMYKTAEGLDLNAMTLALGDLAKQVLTLEAKDAKKYEDELLKGGAGLAPGGGFGGGFGGGRGGEMGMRGGFGGGMGMTMLEETGPTYERRRMIDRLLAIADGASAVAAGGSDESKAKLNELVVALRSVAEPAAEDKALLAEIAPDVQNLSVDVNKLVATWIPAAAEEDEPAAGEFGAEEAADEAPAADAAKPAEDAEKAPAEPAAAEPAAPAAEPAAEEAAPPAANEPAAEAPAAAAG